MSQPLDPFAISFDTIDVDRSAFSRAAFEQAGEHYVARAAAHARKTEPGFRLLDDADGRFVVDPLMGVVSLASDALLESERGAVHNVRLHVIEASGAAYELALQLRITGRIPSMVGAEDIDFLAGATPCEVESAPVAAPPQAIAPRIDWTSYSVVRCQTGKAPLTIEETPFGAALAPLPTPAAPGPFRLHLYTPLPAAAAADADWSL